MNQTFPENAFLFFRKIAFDSAWRKGFSLPFWAAVFSALALQARAGVVLTTLHSFGTFENGSGLENALVQGTDGYFYGTAGNGGLNGYGTVFKISTNGTLTSLYSFTGGDDGGGPQGALVQGSDGYFYGTTGGGGTNGSGTVFRISTNGMLTSLYSFTGAHPNGLARGADGNFYGTTSGGGAHGQGSIFKISLDGTFSFLYSFTGGSDGSTLLTPLVQGSDGYFYGTTAFGGQDVLPGTNGGGHGTVFQVSTNGMLTTLYSFTGGNDGSFPGALVQGGDGNFYGTTYYGGTSNWGTIFKITSSGVYASLYSFTGGDDGASPWAGLVLASDGDFYGVTQSGGTNGGGTMFTISTNGALTSLYAFTGSDRTGPLAPLIQASDGYFYGVTSSAVFKISASGTFATFYNFTADDGSGTEAALVQGSDGYFYGTASSGGSKGLGTVFKISANGTLTSLYSFTGGDDGSSPGTALVKGPDGYFYGTTFGGGTNDAGTIFGINSTGVYTNLYVFSGGNDGGGPNGLVRGSDGYFYGTTRYGGTDPFGTVFKITTNGTLTSLYSFTNGNDGFDPLSALVQGNDGYFYGTTGDPGPIGPRDPGSVFKISTNGMLTTLYTFPGAIEIPSLVQGTDGTVYGTTNGSGTQGVESIFEITPNGTLVTLYSFPGNDDGSTSLNALIQGNDGYFYGTTYFGGTYDAGTVFRIDTNGALTTLYSFTDGNDGGYPQAALVQGSDGSFYGTTSGGGVNQAGTVFRLTIVPECQAATPIGDLVSLSWSTQRGARYQLQYTSELSSSNWTNLGDAVFATNSALTLMDSVTNGPQRFYRLALSP